MTKGRLRKKKFFIHKQRPQGFSFVSAFARQGGGTCLSRDQNTPLCFRPARRLQLEIHLRKRRFFHLPQTPRLACARCSIDRSRGIHPPCALHTKTWEDGEIFP